MASSNFVTIFKKHFAVTTFILVSIFTFCFSLALLALYFSEQSNVIVKRELETAIRFFSNDILKGDFRKFVETIQSPNGGYKVEILKTNERVLLVGEMYSQLNYSCTQSDVLQYRISLCRRHDLPVKIFIVFAVSWIVLTISFYLYLRSKLKEILLKLSGVFSKAGLEYMNVTDLEGAWSIADRLAGEHKQYQQILITLNQNAMLSTIAKQVAHDIRSPLTALGIVIDSIYEMPSEKHELIKSSIGRINDIANDLLRKSKESQSILNQNNPMIKYHEKSTYSKMTLDAAELFSGNLIFDTSDIIPLVDQIVSEKSVIIENESKKISIVGDYHHIKSIITKIDRSHFLRVLSNLINNAIEAISESEGEIIVSIREYQSEFIVSVRDNGIGIPEELLDSLGKHPISYGKELESYASGSGLGIYHAMQFAKSMNGDLTIFSKLGIGTIVTVTLSKF